MSSGASTPHPGAIPRRNKRDVARILSTSRRLYSLFPAIGTTHWTDIPAHRLDRAVRRHLQRYGLTSAIVGYRGYPAHSSVSVNATAIHGIPNARPIQRGDLFTLDVAARAGGWVADTAWTYLMPGASRRIREFYQQSWRAFRSVLCSVGPGRSLYEIARCSQEIAGEEGIAVLPEFVGHGIGRELHEPPVIPFTLQEVDSTAASVVLTEGMTISIEPVYSAGGTAVERDVDGWGYRTVDGAATAHFELTLLVGARGAEILQFDRRAPADLPRDPPFGVLSG